MGEGRDLLVTERDRMAERVGVGMGFALRTFGWAAFGQRLLAMGMVVLGMVALGVVVPRVVVVMSLFVET